MLFLARPNNAAIDEFLARASDEKFSYKAVGATDNHPPDGWTVDHNRRSIGHGAEAWERARQAVRGWKMFDFPWVELCWPNSPPDPGSVVAVLIRHLGFYSLNPAKVVYSIDETDRFGFAYGTLKSHAESGEERFLVERDPVSGEIWYDLYAFSMPNSLLVGMGYPYARHLQKRFAIDSMAAMQRAICQP